MDIFSVIQLFGGLAMFLYGMEVMGDGLKNVSGTTLKKVLERATQNVVMGVFTGMMVTAVIQSSTATIVLTVGLISAGILNLKQAVSIVMGANIGTTVTAQIIRLMDIDSSGNLLLEFFKPTTLAPLALIVGIILIMFVNSPKSNAPGEIFAGFGVLFSGLINMSSSVEPLAESQMFLDLMNRFSDQPLLALLIGIVITVIVQSSSATVGMIQAISVTGAMSFNLIYPLIMGINIGTCVTTAIVCSIGSEKDAKRTGIVHIVFNVIGTIVFMLGITLVKSMGMFPDLWTHIVDSGDIANFQTLFNLVTAILLVPFAGWLVKISLMFVKPDPKDLEERPELHIPDAKLYQVPAMALDETNKAITRMGDVAFHNFRRSCKLFYEFDAGKVNIINDNENNLDNFTDAMDSYLVNLSRHVKNEDDDQLINIYMQTSTNFERVGDHAVNIMEICENINLEKMGFSQNAKEEYGIVVDAVTEIVGVTVEAFKNLNGEKAKEIEPLEEVIDDIVVILKDRHIERLKTGICNTQTGLAFVELLTNLERVADQCSNIGLLILSLSDKTIMGNHHGYLRELHKGNEEIYYKQLKMKKEQYLGRVNALQSL